MVNITNGYKVPHFVVVAIVNGLFLKTVFSTYSLFINKNAIDFCVANLVYFA